MQHQRITWYHGDSSKRTVMRCGPHPEDWGISHWDYEDIAPFMGKRNREVARLVDRLGMTDKWWGRLEHGDPLRAASTAVAYAGITDLGKAAISILTESEGGALVTEMLVVVPGNRITQNCASHIVRQVKDVAPDSRWTMYRRLLQLRAHGEPHHVAFTIPMPGSSYHPEPSAAHEFQRALIRAKLIWLAARDARAAAVARERNVLTGNAA